MGVGVGVERDWEREGEVRGCEMCTCVWVWWHVYADAGEEEG